MRNKALLFAAVAALTLAQVNLAADRKYPLAKKEPALGGGDKLITADMLKIRRPATIAGNAQNVGPGIILFETTYDLVTNNAMMRNIHNYGGNVMAFARMEDTGPDPSPARSTYYAYHDPASGGWLLPALRVENDRSGWGSVVVNSGGQEVVATHGGLEVNVDALQGFGIWTSSLTGEYPLQSDSDLTWPRSAVDGADNIHVIATYFTAVPPNNANQPVIYCRSTDGGNNWEGFRYLFQVAGQNATDPPDTMAGMWLTDGDADSYQIDAWNNKVGAVAWTFTTDPDGFFAGQDILFAESEDNGQTWTFTNVTNQQQNPPAGDDDWRAAGHLDFIYDNNGEPHIVWDTYIATPLDTLEDGTIIPGAGGSAGAPIQHWSPSTGITDAISRFDIPGAEDDTIGVTFTSSSTAHGRAGNGLWWPSLGLNADNELFLAFTSPTPFDIDTAGVPYLDIYATASIDGGRTWGAPPVNVTNSPGTEDKYPSLAKLVDDSLRIVYGSDDVNGGIIQGSPQTTNSFTLYYGFPADQVPTERPSAVQDQPAGKLPATFALSQNYPNPFNPSTNISFDLPRAAHVKLAIYDVSGKLIAELLNARLPAGQHTATWNATAEFASGVYFSRLDTESYSSVKKMMLLK